MPLLNHKLALHDVNDVESHIREAIHDQLKRWGAHLQPDDHDDAMSYLLANAWELSLEYNPHRGWSFSKLLYTRTQQRLVDWYRSRFYDSRSTQPRPNMVALSDADRDELAAAFDFTAAEVFYLINECLELTPNSRWVAAEVVQPALDGEIREAIDEFTIKHPAYTKREVAQMLQELREELECLALLEA